MSKDILSSIEEKLSSFSKGKKNIAAYILQSPHQAAFMTAASLGKAVKVSESTVVRFAGDLGYKGYPDLQKALQDVVMHHLSSKDETPSEFAQDAAVSPEEKALQQEQNNTNLFCKGIDSHCISQAAEILLHCRCAYIIGRGVASCLAEYMERSLDGLLDHVKLIRDTSDKQTLRSLIHISPGDCVLYLCAEEEKSFLPVLNYITDAGAKLLVIHDPSIPYTFDRAEVGLSVPMFDPHGIPSYCISMGILHAIISITSQQKSYFLSETEKKFKEIWEKYYENQSN